MSRFILVSLLAALLLTGCARDPRNVSCAATPHPPSPIAMGWGYYPGYGCGPVPPAQTVFS